MNPRSVELARTWLEDTSEFQSGLLKDLAVTASEYEDALHGTAECLGDEGYETGPLRDLPDGIRRDFEVIASEAQSNEVGAAYQRCAHEFLAAVESVYLAQHSLAADELPRLKAELLSCLNRHGVHGVDGRMSDGQVAEALVAQNGRLEAWACRERFLILTGELGARPPE